MRTIGSFLFERGQEVFRSHHIPVSTFFVNIFFNSPLCPIYRHNGKRGSDLQPKTGKDLVVSHNQRSRVNIIVWGLHKELTMLEASAKFADMSLESFLRGNVLWEGDHIRLALTKKDSKGVS